MDVHEYISVHRCFGLLRQDIAAQERVTFEELAILAHLANAGEPLRMSDLANYQDALRPTITHRAAHLSRLGLIERVDGEYDRRNICCTLTKEGTVFLAAALKRLCENLQTQEARESVSRERMCLALDGSGAVSLSSADLILLALRIDYCEAKGPVSVGELSSCLGILQPTVSMAVNSLVRDGLVTRVTGATTRLSALAVALSSKGEKAAQKIATRIEQV